ncbi:hypothetical protein PRIPAC_97551 [Pristionchus pacificus]|uniref:G protein-coupled receptor n=1 Tax=Pristionchus pacificus TaxID=54126 RepID=A0A2A6D3D0_PRIPA|nr:hypothetical protein PRIPAC_97551 [Pristionchus pacificus]|eukprot:PDM84783.1 G protein-coupled receptor [Pristionchus pacificus]
MVEFATLFVIATFTFGSSFCCLALWTIQKSTALRESFGLLCKFQMLTDLCLLTVTSVFSLIPIEWAPADSSFLSIVITYIAEISYHYSSAMHVLFAINRFIYIVFPTLQQAWRKATPKILVLSAIVTAFHTIMMSILDLNLYWVYDRVTYIWHMTHTEWTDFYVKYFEVLWSTCEISLILILDTVTFGFILFKKFKVSRNDVHMKRRVESRLVLQSFCQCIPTTTVNVVYFFILPHTISPHLKIVFSSIWIVTNLLDALVIILFHFPQAFMNHRRRVSKLVGSKTMGTSALSDSAA